jgi:hypothetical protein
MSAPNNPPFAVSSTDYPLPAWRYWLLFQSWRQFGSWVAILLVSALALQSLALLAGVALLSTAALLGALALGGLVSVVMVLPARFTIAPSSEAAVGRAIDELGFLRYIEVGARDNAVLYRQNLPRALLWDEGNIRLARDGDNLVISGPMANLRRIRLGLLSRK